MYLPTYLKLQCKMNTYLTEQRNKRKWHPTLSYVQPVFMFNIEYTSLDKYFYDLKIRTRKKIIIKPYLSVTFAQHSQIHSAKQQQQINFGNT